MTEVARIPTGVPALDQVLRGGYLSGRTVMVRGGPGLGKTILGFHFLAAARFRQEKALFISFSAGESTSRAYAGSLGLDISQVQFLDLTPGADFFASDAAYEIFSPSEVERGPTTRRIVETIGQWRPARVFIDGASQLRYLHPNAYLYRKQLAAFMRFLADMNCTALFTAEEDPQDPDHALAFLADGVINLARTEEAWKLSIEKLRGSAFATGWHPYRIDERGLQIYPLLEPERLGRPYRPRCIPTGFDALDGRLGGGWRQGSSVLLQGGVGSGKSLLAAALALKWARTGKALLMLLGDDEHSHSYHCEDMGLPLRDVPSLRVAGVAHGGVELSHRIRLGVEAHRAGLVVVDGLRSDAADKTWDALAAYAQAAGFVLLGVAKTEVAATLEADTRLGLSGLPGLVTVLAHRHAALDARPLAVELTPQGPQLTEPHM